MNTTSEPLLRRRRAVEPTALPTRGGGILSTLAFPVVSLSGTGGGQQPVEVRAAGVPGVVPMFIGPP